jgi:hypothetical protein
MSNFCSQKFCKIELKVAELKSAAILARGYTLWKYQFKIKIQFHSKILQNPNVGSFDVSKYCPEYI